MAKNIKTIPASIDTSPASETKERKRVAAYCRVSSEHDQQVGSYLNQVEEWTRRILENNNYDLVEIYGDEGISGTDVTKRGSFLQMINDAKAGKIDLILCKSISRFGRNAVEIISYIRELKNIGVEVYFDTESTSSFDAKCELILSILSSIAQEEVRHISENVRWGIQKRMRDGKFTLATKYFLGYDWDKEKQMLVVNKEQAKIVKFIYESYAEGLSTTAIGHLLEMKGIKTMHGNVKWDDGVIRNIIKNEKYKGDVLMQKGFTYDYLTHRTRLNRGELPQYYIEDNHEPIVSKKLWEKCNLMMTAVGSKQVGIDLDKTDYHLRYHYAGIIICKNCGKYFKRRKWVQGFKTPRIMYQCNGYIEGICNSSSINAGLLDVALADVINQVLVDDKEIFAEIKKTMLLRFSEDFCSKEIDRLRQEADFLKNEAFGLRIERDFTENNKEIQKQLDSVVKKYSTAISQMNYLKSKKKKEAIEKKCTKLILSFLNGEKCKPEDISKIKLRDIFHKIIADITKDSKLLYIIFSKDCEVPKKQVSDERLELIKKEPVFTNTVEYKQEVKTFKLTYKVIII